MSALDHAFEMSEGKMENDSDKQVLTDLKEIVSVMQTELCRP